MNFVRQIYAMRKRLKDDDLLKIRNIVSDEIERRCVAERQSKGIHKGGVVHASE